MTEWSSAPAVINEVQMAINQVSFFLFPPRYQPIVEELKEFKTTKDKPVKLVDSKLVFESSPKVLNSDVMNWLREQGFLEKECFHNVVILYQGQEETFIGMQKIIETSIDIGEEELTELYIRFLLTESTPTHIGFWITLITEPCTIFGFKIMDKNNLLVSYKNFLMLLQNDNLFKIHKKEFEWNFDTLRVPN